MTIKKPLKDKEPAYKTVTSIQNSSIVEAIYEKLMKTPIMSITIEELLSVSLDFWQKWKEALTPKRVLISDFIKTSQTSMLVFEQNSETPEDSFLQNSHLNNLSFTEEPSVEFLSDLKAFAFTNTILPQNPSKMAYVTADAVEVYLSTLSPGSDAHCLTIAKEIHALRAIEMIVDGKASISLIVDGGSQIVAMSE